MSAFTKACFHRRWRRQFPHLVGYSHVGDVGQAAKDWPQLNFIIYHSAYRWAGGGTAEQAWEQLNRTGRIEWVSDLAEIPAQYGVKNVYGDLGQIFAQSTMADPRVCAFMMGTLVKGLGADNVVWGSDAVWTGSPQWQIEALRRLEIPDDMQKNTASSRSARRTVRSSAPSSARTMRGSIASRRSNAQRSTTTASPSSKRIMCSMARTRSNLAYGYIRKSRAG